MPVYPLCSRLSYCSPLACSTQSALFNLIANHIWLQILYTYHHFWTTRHFYIKNYEVHLQKSASKMKNSTDDTHTKKSLFLVAGRKKQELVGISLLFWFFFFFCQRSLCHLFNYTFFLFFFSPGLKKSLWSGRKIGLIRWPQTSVVFFAKGISEHKAQGLIDQKMVRSIIYQRWKNAGSIS